MENVVGCDMMEEKSNGKSVFRIIYFSQNAHDFKHYDFETESDKAGESLSVEISKFSGILGYYYRFLNFRFLYVGFYCSVQLPRGKLENPFLVHTEERRKVMAWSVITPEM